MLVCYTRTKRISSSTTIHGCPFGQSSSIQGNNSGPSLQMNMGTSFSRPVRIASSAGLSWFGTIGINEAPTEFEFHESYDLWRHMKNIDKKGMMEKLVCDVKKSFCMFNRFADCQGRQKLSDDINSHLDSVNTNLNSRNLPIEIYCIIKNYPPSVLWNSFSKKLRI